MSQRVWTCSACGWRGVAVGGPACRAGTPPAACGRCGRAGLVCTSEAKPKVSIRCADCGEWVVAHQGSRYCAVDRWRHRGRRPKLYVWTPERDQVLRDRYDGKVRHRAREIAQRFGWPVWVIKKRSGQLGLCYPIEPHPWTPQEVAFLEEWTGRKTSLWMARRLHRSETSVVLKQKRLGMSRRVRDDGYTLRDLEACFGCDHHVIERWVREGWLQTKRRGTKRAGKQGDVWKVTDRDLRSFIRQHPTAFRLDKVDQLWFLDLVLGTRLLAEGAEDGRAVA